MPFRRRYARYRLGRKNKYNINTATWEYIQASAWTAMSDGKYYTDIGIVDPTTTGGTRKVTRFTLNMAIPANLDSIYWWALVYVPEGTQPNVPVAAGEGYAPSQYVLSQGMLTNQQPVRINTPMSRNLNQNDKIQLIIWHNFGTAPVDVALGGFVQYAICYN